MDRPSIETPDGRESYAPDRVGRLARQSLCASAPISVRVMPLDGRCDFDSVAESLHQAWAALTRNRLKPDVRPVDLPVPDPSSVTLILLPDTIDLAARADLRARLAAWEGAGGLFKLARMATLGQRFAVQNICFDLASLTGRDFWQCASAVNPAVAFDAGHDTSIQRSRWASAFVDDRLHVASLKAIDTELAEHIPQNVVDQFWPSDAKSMVLRDGRLARERDSMRALAKIDERWLLEVKKHPGTILFRDEAGRSVGAEFGDAVVDAHGDVLLQTLSQDTSDCHHPLRLSLASSADRDAQVQAIFAQTAVPGLTLFRPSRLPGAIYWADLASKLDKSGWTQVIGRGWRLESVVPKF